MTVEMDPLDAGTDNGFTFTAPNWPTSPQGVIYRITSRYPAHPASSFFYPKSKRLPPIATFQFIKVSECVAREKLCARVKVGNQICQRNEGKVLLHIPFMSINVNIKGGYSIL